MNNIVMPVQILIVVSSNGIGSTSPKDFGLVLIIIVVWFIGIWYTMKFTDNRFDNPIIGLIAYLLATGILMYVVG
jgi:RsiW-degrading membrane proteinase PrsW (M82 family)